MNIEDTKAHVGKLVMSRDAGIKLMRSVGQAHGPYPLIQVTKAGMAIISKQGYLVRVPPSLLSPFTPAPSPQSGQGSNPSDA